MKVEGGRFSPANPTQQLILPSTINGDICKTKAPKQRRNTETSKSTNWKQNTTYTIYIGTKRLVRKKWSNIVKMVVDAAYSVFRSFVRYDVYRQSTVKLSPSEVKENKQRYIYIYIYKANG